ncbi:MAG: N-acyl-D-aspartate/D-glutamate deacylase [Cryomorphaceae bacterium]|jgi:N-acyl-D-aspartate/D-glutamate deacylase
MTSLYDLLIKNARVLNDGEPPVNQDIAIKDGRIIKRASQIAVESADKVVDATGLLAIPGMFDIHTHYDLELEVAPGLPESVRHGTTSVVISNCSLGLAYGAQRNGEIDPIVDCYARVENIPKSVLRSCADEVDWNNPAEYLEHLDSINLGPNIVTMIPHSMLRIEVMGFQESVTRDPSNDELNQMEALLRAGLRIGYAGFSTDALPFHYLANQPNCHKTIPTQFAKYAEIKKLTQVVREEGGIWQATPPKDSPISVLKTFMLSSGRLHGKPLRTTVVAALDVANNRNLVKLAKLLANLLNSKLFAGDFHMQALGAPFKIWSDGAVTPIAEEIPELRALNETDMEDRDARAKILNDPDYIKLFRAMWMKGKRGWSFARLKRILRLEDYAFDRDLNHMMIELCPQKNWQGLSYQAVLDRVLDYKRGNIAHGMQDDEQSLIQSSFFWVSDEADFVIQTLRCFDTDISWSTVTANRDLEQVRKLIMNPKLLPGFNDSGAHLTNMAFYDVNLRSLKLAALGGEGDLNYMVKRLTKDAADVFGVQGGTIYEGDVADLVLIDPVALADYDGEARVERVYRKEFQHDQLVNRSEGLLPLVLIAGEMVWQEDAFGDALGSQKLGRVLKPRKLLDPQEGVSQAA